MVKLLKKGIEFEWKSEQEEAFQKVKEEVTGASNIRVPMFYINPITLLMIRN